MVEKDEDDSFIKDFMERAKQRQTKLAQIENPPIEKGEVSYPNLSPLPEEDNQSGFVESVYTDDKGENASPERSEFNYSSDLSLECDKDDDVYRAEPVVCHSSPEHILHQYHPQTSPRKHIQNVAPIHQQQLQQQVPLQERQMDQKPTSSQSLPEQSKPEQSYRDMRLKAEGAHQKRTQLKKALDMAKHGSKAHIDAAQKLQIAEIEHRNFISKVAEFKQGVIKSSESLGSITISNMELKTTNKLKNDLADESISHYFFCIVHCSDEVKFTEIIDTNTLRKQDTKSHLRFKDRITFADLPPDFNMKVEAFELIIGQQSSKLFRLTPSKKSRITPESHFKRVGSLKLTIADRDLDHKLLVQWSKHEESKYIERELRFKLDIKPEQLPCKAGLLHNRFLDENGAILWTRRWVDLSQGKVRFWGSEEDAKDDKKPNHTIEFTEFCSESVKKLTHDDEMYRQNSFVFFTYEQVVSGEKDTLLSRILKDDPKFKIVKHQLAARTKEDRDSWCAIFDQSLQCFREWHGKTKIFSTNEINEIFYIP